VRDGREQVPHVCELRLELLQFNNATHAVAPIMEKFYAELKQAYIPTHIDMACLEKITREVLDKPPEGHRLRKFRCHLARRYGSTVCGWRKAFGGQRLLNFQRFREVCYSLHCGEHVTELWQELDPNRGGCISLWELAPDAVSLLVKLRTRMLGALVHSTKEDAEDFDPSTIFSRLTSFSRPTRQGCLEQHEFRLVSKVLGLSIQEADRAFNCLDHFPGSHHAPPAMIDVTDIKWLKGLITLVDAAAVLVTQEVAGDPLTLTMDNGSPVSMGGSSYGMGGTPTSGGPANAWASPSQGAAARPKSPRPKADNKPGAGRAAQGLSDMGVDVGASAQSTPNIEVGEEPGSLNDLGIEMVEDDEEYDDDEEEGEEEDEEDDDEEPADQEETW